MRRLWRSGRRVQQPERHQQSDRRSEHIPRVEQQHWADRGFGLSASDSCVPEHTDAEGIDVRQQLSRQRSQSDAAVKVPTSIIAVLALKT